MNDAGTLAMALWVGLRARDRATANHCRRVAGLGLRLAEALGLSGPERAIVFRAGLVHDVGKLGTRDSVLPRPGALDDRGLVHLRCHVERGVRVLARFPALYDPIPGVATHHEWVNGRGYPAGVANVPTVGKVLAVRDVFDALTHARSHKPTFTRERAFEVLEAGRGAPFDPEVLDVFLATAGRRRRGDILTGVNGHATAREGRGGDGRT